MLKVPRYQIEWQHLYDEKEFGAGDPIFVSREEAEQFIELMRKDEDPEGVKVFKVVGPVFVESNN